MDINPFDDFGAELRDALPKSENAAPLPEPDALAAPASFDLRPKKQFDLNPKQPTAVMNTQNLSMSAPPMMGSTNGGAMNGGVMNGYSNSMNAGAPAAALNGGGMMAMGGTHGMGLGGSMGGGAYQPQLNFSDRIGMQPTQGHMQAMGSPEFGNANAAVGGNPVGNNANYANNAAPNALTLSSPPSNPYADSIGGAVGQPAISIEQNVLTTSNNPSNPYADVVVGVIGQQQQMQPAHSLQPHQNPIDQNQGGYTGSLVQQPTGSPMPTAGTGVAGNELNGPVDQSALAISQNSTVGPASNDDFGGLFSSPPSVPPPPPDAQPPTPPAASPSAPAPGDSFGGMFDSAPPLTPSSVESSIGDEGFGGLFDSNSAPSTPPQQTESPWGPSAPTNVSSSALVPSESVDDDFFGIFGSGPKPDVPAEAAEKETGAATTQNHAEPSISAESKSLSPGGLPPGGRVYEAKVYTPYVGVMFFTPQELTDSLFLETDKKLVDALEDRPVVGFMVEDSAAREAKVNVGHVLLTVNGVEVKTPKEARDKIQESGRPVTLSFYVPDTRVFLAEGMYMVKYDTRDRAPPLSPLEWKPKYVVVGGIIAKSWQINMYRSKAEYDIAVMETQARRPVSVKVKQFGLYNGARILNQDLAPRTIKYRSEPESWKYIIVKSPSTYPIKIAAPSIDRMKPVHKGILRVIAARQKAMLNQASGYP